MKSSTKSILLLGLAGAGGRLTTSLDDDGMDIAELVKATPDLVAPKEIKLQGDNAWRGGARKKGGKIGYRRS